MAGALMGFGSVFAVIGAGWLILTAFRTSTDWGLLSLLVPFAVIVFVVRKWQTAKAPAFVFLAGLVCVFAGYALLLAAAQEAGMHLQAAASAI
jgi:hypothetical protein